MGRTDTEEYANWEDGFERGQKYMVELIKLIGELLEDYELSTIESKLEELREDKENGKIL